MKTTLKSLISSIFKIKTFCKCLAIVILPATLFYAISFWLMSKNGFTSYDILMDPAQHLGVSSFTGFLSNIGNALWVSAAAISFFTAIIVNNINKNHKQLLLLTGLLSITLAADDFFMIHDRYVHQLICYAFYGVVSLTLFIKHHKLIFSVNAFAFLAACSLLGLSIISDLFQEKLFFIDYRDVQIFEEGFKFVGAATWLYYAISLASFAFKRNLAMEETPNPNNRYRSSSLG